jgi:hypothetical protein
MALAAKMRSVAPRTLFPTRFFLFFARGLPAGATVIQSPGPFIILSACAALSLSACATVAVPVGDWSRPVDLELNSESLTGTRVAVDCLRERKANGQAPQLQQAQFTVCARLERSLEQVGATVPSDEGPVDLTLVYIEKGVTEQSASGLSSLAFTFSDGLISLIATSASEAELQVKDGHGAILERAPVRLEAVTAIGLSAIVGKAMDMGGESARDRALSRLFFDYARNRVFSQIVRRRAQASQAASL